ncbi:geranylgeranyl pyrophosphate synthase, chloroplastic-like [Phalaenopsis equestris]|uniref:geranylgeranyl pyrophosphate synthase, chloroplastic-like n=1 Tax=Phalaenopsis equestris TaxID=78828 RepID=UPI0009E3E115|nr:geranylgeranyl pyrophosphate synthase, chloroplastic-like [Phalaenopsis equestris]
MAAIFPSIPSNFKPPQISQTLTRLRRPNRTLCTATSDQSYLSASNADISSHLLRSLPVTIHPSVKAPIHSLLSSPIPPTIAPPLCLAATELVGGNPNSAINAACALHLIHAVTHTRTRTAPPLTEFSPGVLLLTGDGLLVLAYEMVARSSAVDAGPSVRVLKEVARTAAAVAAAYEGGREGELAAGAAACGVILGGGNEEEVERGRRVGMFAGKMELVEAEVELRLGFEDEKAGAVRRLLEEMRFTQTFVDVRNSFNGK